MPDGTTHPDEIFRRLRTDLLYYGPRCLMIRPKKGPPERIRWNRAQLHVHERIEAQRALTGKVRAIVLKYRQGGITTYVQGRFYHRCTGAKGVRAFILTHEGQATENVFGITKRFHENCPDVVRPSADRDSNKELNFNLLDSGYKVSTAGSKGTGRSQTIQLFHGSEVAFWPHANEHAAGVLQAIPDEPGTESILESTFGAVGDFFDKTWQEAEAGQSDYIPIFLPWFWQEEYQREVPEGFELTPDEIEYKALHGLSNRQMAWRRAKIAEFNGDEALFKREYPADVAEAREQGGAESFIPSPWVRRARKAECEAIGPYVLGVDVARFGKDRTVLSPRRGRKIFARTTLHKRDTMFVAGAVAVRMKESAEAGEPFDAVFVDVIGIGAGVVDRLRQIMETEEYRALGYDESVIIAVNGSESPMDGVKYGNKRAECWGRMKDWYDPKGGPVDIPDDDAGHADITAPSFYYDAHNRTMIEKKEKIKERGRRSPDIGDADALTFAEPVQVRRREPESTVTSAGGGGGWMGG